MSMTSTRALRRIILPVALGATMLLGACGGGDAFEEGSGDASGGGGGGSLTVGGSDNTEMRVMQNMYALLLEKAGYSVDIQQVGEREIYRPALEKGTLDVVPEYAATLAENLNLEANGEDAPAVSSNDVTETVAALKPLAEAKGLTVLEPSQAIDSNGFYVTKEFAEANDLTTLSDLGAMGEPVVLAAGDECLDPQRVFCAPGLKKTYGIDVSSVTGDGYASTTGKQKVVNGEAQLGLSGSTDGTLAGLGLVVLEDDKKLQAADNLTPVVNTESAGDPKVADALNALSEVLTTDDLIDLNSKVDSERQRPEDVAKDYLVEKGLIDG